MYPTPYLLLRYNSRKCKIKALDKEEEKKEEKTHFTQPTFGLGLYNLKIETWIIQKWVFGMYIDLLLKVSTNEEWFCEIGY